MVADSNSSRASQSVQGAGLPLLGLALPLLGLEAPLGARRPQFRLETGVEGLALGAGAGLPILLGRPRQRPGLGLARRAMEHDRPVPELPRSKAYCENREDLRHQHAASMRRDSASVWQEAPVLRSREQAVHDGNGFQARSVQRPRSLCP